MGTTGKRIHYIIYLVVVALIFLLALEFSLRKLYNFGSPVLYIPSAVYGYRPAPNQSVRKHTGKVVKTNNLGIRASEDWTGSKKNKVLFLGNSVTYGGAVSNEELFSLLVTEDIDTLISGSAGVNAWGVNNIYALIKDYGFTPAQIYVTVLIESDFRRGLQRASLLANHWYAKPKSALHHLIGFFLREQAKSFYTKNEVSLISEQEKIRDRSLTVQIAARNLHELDNYLKEKGYRHFIFISPTRKQVYENESIDSLVGMYIRAYDLDVHYLLDDVRPLSHRNDEIFFKDDTHLNEYGHRIWAQVIRQKLFYPKKL